MLQASPCTEYKPLCFQLKIRLKTVPTDQNLAESLKTIEIMQNSVRSSIITVFWYSKPEKLCERNQVKRKRVVTEMGTCPVCVILLQFPPICTMFWVQFDYFVLRIHCRGLQAKTTSEPEKTHSRCFALRVPFQSWISITLLRTSYFGPFLSCIFAVWALLSPEMDAKWIQRLTSSPALLLTSTPLQCDTSG